MTNQKLMVSLESPQHGFMSLRLSAEGESFVSVASYTPYDSLRDLIAALCDALAGDCERIVKWNSEPEEFDFRLYAREDSIQLDIIRYPDHRRLAKTASVVFTFCGPKLETCWPFWKELRDLHRRTARDEFDRQWRREFPEGELQELTKRIRSFKRRA
ncbi:MAG TPA: hypothetical protein VF766_04360 [Pyrinomonadaceae bacterium]